MTRCATCGHVAGVHFDSKKYGPTCEMCFIEGAEEGVAVDHKYEPAIPASRVRELARAWTSRVGGDDMYQDGRIDARNECADALDSLLRDAGVEP